MRKKMIILLTPCTISINAIEKAMIALESTGVNNSINPRIVPTIPKASSQPHCENPSDFSQYWQLRKQQDSDLWVLELDVANAERFIGLTGTSD